MLEKGKVLLRLSLFHAAMTKPKTPPSMKYFFALFAGLGFICPLEAQELKSNVPYVENGHVRQVLDVYTPKDATNLPVVFWIHGGGWQGGDKTDLKLKPKWFGEKGFVLVSPNYRLLPEVDMGTLLSDVAKAAGWVRQNVAKYGGDPSHILIGGHSAGAQLAALLCTDERYLNAENVSFQSVVGCVPVDGDTYDIPAIIETAETRRRVHHQAQATFGHREKFGNDPAKHLEFSAVTHVQKNKSIPPFLILHVANHPDNSAQAARFGAVLKENGVLVTVFAAKDTDHVRLNDNIGVANDPATRELSEFLTKIRAK